MFISADQGLLAYLQDASTGKLSFDTSSTRSPPALTGRKARRRRKNATKNDPHVTAVLSEDFAASMSLSNHGKGEGLSRIQSIWACDPLPPTPAHTKDFTTDCRLSGRILVLVHPFSLLRPHRLCLLSPRAGKSIVPIRSSATPLQAVEAITSQTWAHLSPHSQLSTPFREHSRP